MYAALPNPPQPDPDPSAIVDGWYRYRPTHAWWTSPMRLPGREGLWRCHVTRSPLLRCVRVG